MEGDAGAVDYDLSYHKGWGSASRFEDLESAENHFLDRSGEERNGRAHLALEDGWIDWASEREMFHLRDWTPHPHCSHPLYGLRDVSEGAPGHA